MKRALIIFFGLLFTTAAYSQGFERIYNSPRQELIYLARPATNGFHIVRASYNSTVDSVGTAFMDYYGNLSYSPKSLDTASARGWYQMCHGKDSTFYIANQIEFAQYQYNFLVAKYNASDDLKWATYVGDSIYEQLGDLEEGANNSVFLATHLLGTNNHRIIKLDSLGNVLWKVTGSNLVVSLTPTADGGCIIQYALNSGGVIRDSFEKLDANGNSVSTKTGQRTGGGLPRESVRTSDGGLITVGSINLPPSGAWANLEMVINKYSPTLDSVWQFSRINTTERLFQPLAISETDNGRIIFSGQSIDTLTTTSKGVYIGMLEADGSLVWFKHYDLGLRKMFAIEQAPTGNVYVFGNGNFNMWVMTVDSLGNLTKNHLTGIIYEEDDPACVYDGTETGIQNWLMKLDGNLIDYYATSDEDGHYFVQTQVDSYTIDLHPLSPYWQPCVDTLNHVFSDPEQQDTIHFGVEPVIECPWLELSVTGPCWVRPGSVTSHHVQYCNYGTVGVQNVELSVTIPSSLSITSVSAPNTVNGQVYSFSIDSLGVGECATIVFNGVVDTTVQAGNILCLQAKITPDSICLPGYTGYDPTDFTFCSPIVASYDPNVKTSNPIGEGPEHYILANTRLNYNIQFQNTGTDTAFRVVIIDTLPPQLDVTTIKPGASSHNYTYQVYDQGVVKFTFDPIILPDSNVNEPASHGYVGFSIEQQPDLATGTQITNTAAIYFDFNEPVITEPWIYTIGTEVGIEEPEMVEIQLYPNPGNGLLTISGAGTSAIMEQVEVYDAVGKLILVKYLPGNNADDKITLDLSGEPTGLKFVRVKVGSQWVSKRYMLVR